MSQALKYLLVFILGICCVLLLEKPINRARNAARKTMYLQDGIHIHKMISNQKNMQKDELVFFKGVYIKGNPEMMFAFNYDPADKANKIVMASVPYGHLNVYMDGHGKFDNNQLSDSELLKEFPDIFSNSPDVFKTHNSSNQKPSTTVTSENQKP